MQNGIDFKDLVLVFIEICLGVVYGITICLIFWKQSRVETAKVVTTRRIIFLLTPAIFTIISWFGPDYARNKEIMGFVFPLYESISIIFSIYPIPAFLSVFIILKARKNPSCWLYAAFPFLAVIIFLIFRLLLLKK